MIGFSLYNSGLVATCFVVSRALYVFWGWGRLNNYLVVLIFFSEYSSLNFWHVNKVCVYVCVCVVFVFACLFEGARDLIIKKIRPKGCLLRYFRVCFRVINFLSMIFCILLSWLVVVSNLALSINLHRIFSTSRLLCFVSQVREAQLRLCVNFTFLIDPVFGN